MVLFLLGEDDAYVANVSKSTIQNLREEAIEIAVDRQMKYNKSNMINESKEEVRKAVINHYSEIELFDVFMEILNRRGIEYVNLDEIDQVDISGYDYRCSFDI